MRLRRLWRPDAVQIFWMACGLRHIRLIRARRGNGWKLWWRFRNRKDRTNAPQPRLIGIISPRISLPNNLRHAITDVCAKGRARWRSRDRGEWARRRAAWAGDSNFHRGRKWLCNFL